MAAPVSRFIARHSSLQRIVRRIPIMTKFMAFFAPDELTPKPIEPPHIAPVYNARARKPKGLTLG